jgi:hypothetical protein
MLKPLHRDDLCALIDMFINIFNTPLCIKREPSLEMDFIMQNPDLRIQLEGESRMASYRIEKDRFKAQRERLRDRYGEAYIAMFRGVPAIVGDDYSEVARAFDNEFGMEEVCYTGCTFIESPTKLFFGPTG